MRVRHRVLLALIGLWVRIFYRFRAHGMEHIPQQGGCVIAASHSGKLLADMFAFLAVARRRTPAVIMPTTPGGVRMRGGGGWFPRLMQAAVQLELVRPLRVQRGGSSPVASNLAALKALQDGEAILIFPEGEVSWDGRLKPARPGAAWLALRGGVPVIPCDIRGSYDVWPRWRERIHLTGKIVVCFGAAFKLSDEIPEWIDQDLLDRSGERIMTAIGRLSCQ